MRVFLYFFLRMLMSAVVLGLIEGVLLGALIGFLDPDFVFVRTGRLEGARVGASFGGYFGLVVFGIPSGILMGIVVGLHARWLTRQPTFHGDQARRIGGVSFAVALVLALVASIYLFRFGDNLLELFLPFGIPVILATTAGSTAWFWTRRYFGRAEARGTSGIV